MLGLDWEYDRHEVTDDGLADFLGSLDARWRGLSLTMPLKRRVAELVPEVDPIARATRQGNTILLDRGRPVRAFNTDVHGVTQAFADAGVSAPTRATVLGGGATAESAAFALTALGADVTIAVRDVEKASASGAFAAVRVIALADSSAALAASEAVVSTIPPNAEFSVEIPALGSEQTLLDVAYSPWPTSLAAGWEAAGGSIVHGLEMLLHQAVHQVRIFVSGDPGSPLPDEPAVIRAMRAAVE